MTLKLASILLVASCAGSPDEMASAVTRNSSGPRLFSGVLTAASKAEPDVVVRQYVEQHPDVAPLTNVTLDAANVRRFESGAVVTIEQRHRGLPVVGGSITARTDAEGRLRWLRSSLIDLPRSLDLAPLIDKDELVQRLRAQSQFADAMVEQANATPIILAIGAYASAPRLAWQVDLPLDARFRALRVYADATSGDPLLVTDRMQRAAEHVANVYKTNPVATPQLTPVTFDHLPSGATTLADDSFDVYNCIDERTCVSWPDSESGMLRPAHMCSFEKRAMAASGGSFTGIAPPVDHASWGDPFAEIEAYYQVRRALDTVRARLGAPTLLSNVRFTVIANAPGQFMDQPPAPACVAGSDGTFSVPADSHFEPLNNAAFGPLNEIPGVMFPAPLNAPVMFFGQAAQADLAYDGDVAYHEFGHGMFHFIGSRHSGAKRIPDELGLDPSPGAMDEAFADYLSFSITGDPVIGEYSTGGTGFRTAANTKTCPANLRGEEHEDSEAWSGALWSIRQSFSDPQRAMMDGAILRTMMAITDNDDFRTVAELVVKEIEVSMGADAAQRAKNELAARGFTTECNQRVIELKAQQTLDMFYAFEVGPGVLQLRVDLEKAAPRLGVKMAVVPIKDGDMTPPAVTLHVKSGTDPIRWSWAAATMPKSDATIHVPFKVERIMNGDTLAYSAVAVVNDAFPAGTYYFQVENATEGGLIFAGVSAGVVDDKADGEDSDDGLLGGCGVGRSAGFAPLIALAAALRRRRRRR